MKSFIAIICMSMLLTSTLVFANGSQEATPASTKQSQASEPNFFDTTVKIIIPYGAGGTHDVVSRKFAEVGSKYTKAPIICENVTGGDGIVAGIQFTQKAANVKEIMTTSYGLWYQKIVKGDAIKLDLSKIHPIGTFDDRSYLLYVRADSPYKTLNDLIAESKKREILLSAGAIGADAHLCCGGLIHAAGGQCRLVAYEGGAEQINALLNGEVDCFVGTSQVGKQFLELKKVRALVAFKDFDFTGFKDSMGLVVPNVKDLGYPQCAITGGGFLSVVGGASEKTAKDVEDLMKKVWADPDFRNFTLEQGLNIYECYGADLAKHIKEAEANAKLAAQGLGLIK